MAGLWNQNSDRVQEHFKFEITSRLTNQSKISRHKQIKVSIKYEHMLIKPSISLNSLLKYVSSMLNYHHPRA